MQVLLLLSIFVLFSIKWSQSLVINVSDFNPSNEINNQGSKDMKIKLELELRSLMSPKHFYSNPSSFHSKQEDNSFGNQLLILPKYLLSAEMFNKLGLNFLTTESYLFNLSINSNLNHENILIPKDSKNMFIFNTSHLESIQSGKHNNVANFIDNSPPFNLPNFMNLVDYYLVIPKSYLVSKTKQNTSLKLITVYSNLIIQSSGNDFPIFRQCLSKNKPLMVFMFNSNNINDFKQSLNPIMNIKNYLPTNGQKSGLSTFFDNFASSWISSINYESLIHSLFCTTSSKDLNESYCIKIQDNRSIHLFPAFYDISMLMNSILTKRNESINEAKFEKQNLQPRHNKLFSPSKKLNNITYGLTEDVENGIERFDIKVDSKIYKVQGKIHSYFEKLNEKKKQYFDRMEDKQDEVKNNIQEKNKISKQYRFRPTLSQKSSDVNDAFEIGANENSHEENDNKSKFVALKKGLISQRSYFVEEEEISLNNESEGGFILPLSLVRVAEKNIEAPRSKKFSQIIFSAGNNFQPIFEEPVGLAIDRKSNENFEETVNDQTFEVAYTLESSSAPTNAVTSIKSDQNLLMISSTIDAPIVSTLRLEPMYERTKKDMQSNATLTKRFSIFSDDENCEKITWFNIFHHSIFGKPNFCINN